MPTEAESQIIRTFLEASFGIGFKPGKLAVEEVEIIKDLVEFVDQKFKRMRYPLGLALDFTLLAQQLSLHDAAAKSFRSDLMKKDLFQRYTLVTARAGREANTLTLTFKPSDVQHEVGIRKLEENVGELFVRLNRPGYPSAYVYNTGQWHKFQDTLLVPCFRLSESARYRLYEKLIDYGLSHLTPNPFLGRESPRVRLFEEIVRHYPRSHKGENAGALFQGLVAGYMKADRPHLSFVVDKTRTGSARQSRIGDIDGYFGLDLEVSVKAKDNPLTSENVEKEVGEFLAKSAENRIMALVFAQSLEPAAKQVIEGHGAVSITVEDLLATAATWDWRKQDSAVHGLLHFLAHVEQNPDAVNRLLTFIAEKDSTHDSLTFYKSV
jgi:hypothetical protein